MGLSETEGNMRQLRLLALIPMLILFIIAQNAIAFDKKLNYQGRITDNNGVPVTDGAKDMILKIYDAVTGGTLLWTETHNGANQITTTDGLFSTTLGDITAINLDFNTGSYWLDITVSGTTYTPRQAIAATAMSLNADLLDGQHGSYYQNASNINAGTLSTNYFSAYSDLTAETKIGTGAAQVAAGNHTHTNMVTGTGTATRVAFWDSGSTISSNANLYWDNTNSRLGIGTTSPTVALHVSGNSFFDLPGGTAAERNFTIKNAGQTQIDFGSYPGSWTPAIQIQNNDNSRIFWVSPLDGTSGYNARIRTGATGLDVYTGGTTTDTGTLALSLDTSGNATVGNNLNTNGTDIYINRDGVPTDESIYFYDDTYNDEYLRWEPTPDQFHFSNDLSVTGYLTLTKQITSTLAAGTMPFVLTSNTMSTNLNADLLDGYHFTDLENRYVNVPGDTMTGTLNLSGAATNLIFDNASGYIQNSGGDSWINDTLKVTGNVYPSADNSYSLGLDPVWSGSTYRWNKVHVSQGMEARWNGGTPYIDFSNDNTSDYDSRLILTGDDVTELQGSGLTVFGTTYVGSTNANKMVKFTDAWSGYPDSSVTGSEISNDTTTYKTLMIIGNKSYNGNFRRVSVWDRLDVNGPTTASAFAATGYQSKLGPGTGADNQWHQVDCDAGYAIANFTVYVTGSYMDGNMTIACANLGNLMTATCAWTTPTVNADNTWHYGNCPAGTIARGIKMYANGQLDYGLSLNCCNATSGSVTKYTDWTTAAVNGYGNDDCHHGAQCPTGTYLTNIGIYASSYLDGNMVEVCGAPNP
jgi:hypothetical protein